MSEKTEIKVSCTDQVLKITESPVLASGGLSEVRVVFTFCDKWKGFAKTAIFYRDVEDPYYAVLEENDTCIIPWEVCYEEGTFLFGVFGDKGRVRRTSVTVRYKTKNGAISAEMKPSDPTPEMYDQIMAMLAEARESQNAFVTSAEAALADAVTATENANTAAGNANTATENANAATANANQATQNANDAASNANAEAGKVTQAAADANAATNNANSAAGDARAAAEETLAAKEAFLEEAQEALEVVHDTATEDAPAIICEAAGEVISVADAAYRPLKGLSIYGKTIQNGTPTPSAPVALESVGESIGVTVAGKNLLPFPYATTPQTMSGVTFTHGTDGTITCNGTASEKLWYQLNKNFVFLPGVTYTLSGGHAGGTGDTYILYCEGTYNGAGFFYADTGNGITFSFENGATGKIYITIAKGITVSNIVFRPQVEIGNTATVYEPYKGQTLTATAEGGLPGIPVTSGGNYTDEAGQQWICDEVDFARGVYIQNVYTFPLPADGAWTTMDTGTAGYLEFGLALPKSSYSDDASAKKEIPKLCNRFRSVSSNDVYNCINGVAIRRANTLYIYYDALAQGTVEDFKQWLAVHSTTVLYPLATPIETPLTAEELAAFAALHSNKPNTTAFNDAGAEMKLSYVADTKAYIDQKIAAISAAMLNN